MDRWWQRLVQRPQYRVLAVAIAIVIVVTVLLLWQHGHGGRLHTNPLNGTQAELHKLSKTAAELGASFSVQDPAKATKAYLSYMSNIQSDCGRINSYYDSWKAGNAQHNAELFSQSRDLCADLSKLALFSKNLYTPIKPLMLADTTPHRYQTLWPFAGRMRSSAINDTAQALPPIKSLLTGRSSDDVDFPSDAVSNLTDLQNSIVQSSGLGYLPALRTFQLRMLGERERYWTQYAGLPSLEQELQNLGN